jgi:signal transduction histidine kinase
MPDDKHSPALESAARGARIADSVRIAEAARAAAEAERARLLSLLSQVPAVVNFLRGPKLVWEYAHPRALETLGGRELLGKPLLEAVPEHRDQPFARLLEAVYQTGEPASGHEALVKTRSVDTGALEESYWSYTYLPVRNAAGEVEGVMTFDIDVTSQVRALKQAEQLMAELRLADQRKDEFLAMLAHELRNPLAAISMALTLLEGVDGDAAKMARHRETARRQLGNLARLVDDLLDVSRITRGQVELVKRDIDLATLVQSAVTATRPALDERKHELTVTLAPGTYRLAADATRLEQVLVNLLTNAAKYTEPGGKISVRLAQESGSGSPAAVLSVRDTGRGIPPGLLDRVFDMFVQVSPSRDRTTGGLGLGLTLVRQLVELHGGSVSAHSEGLGKGSEFVVRLPLGQHDGAGAELGAGPGPAPAGQRRILIVEDSEDARETLREFLTGLGHDVQIAQDGEEGAARLLELRPDVALVDVGLPGIDGYELARRVRAAPAGHELYLVAITGYGGADAKARAETAGFDLHLTKPVDVEELRRVVGWVKWPG